MKIKDEDFSFNVELVELRQVVEILLDHLERLGYNSVEIKHPYYWEILTPEVYDQSREPSDFAVGDVHDEWLDLRKMIRDRDLVVTPAFAWLGAVCRAIADHTEG